MLTEQEWKEFDTLCDGDTYAQSDEAGAQAMLDGVKLALAVLDISEGFMVEGTPARMALEYVYSFANWNTLPLHETYWRWCMVENYGEEEADYLINEEGWKPGHPRKEGE